MQVTPRYESPPVLRLDVVLGDVALPLVRQRRRLGDILAALDEEQWRVASRCDAWTLQDVIAHLNGATQYWTISLAKGFEGDPTRYLAGFDPVATPAEMVDGLRAMTPAQVLEQYLETVDQLAGVVTDLDDNTWSMLAEAPPGHIEARAVALHALWDSWTHERDILVPLGETQVIEADEVIGCLYYCASIGPALAASRGATRTGALAVTATDHDVSFVVHAGSTVTVSDGAVPADAAHIRGDAVALVEGFTFRGPLEHGLADEDRWLLGGLDEAFDRTPAA